MLIANSSGGADPLRHASHYGALPYRDRRINFYACLARACLQLPAGRLRPAAAVTPAPGEAPEARVSTGGGGSRLVSVVTRARALLCPVCPIWSTLTSQK